MPRPPKPQSLIDWENMYLNPPRMCHNCDYYDSEGHCQKHNATPPEDFAGTDGACDQWVQLIPF